MLTQRQLNEKQYFERIATSLESAKEWNALAKTLASQLEALREMAREYGKFTDYDILTFCHSIVILTRSKEIYRDINVLLDQIHCMPLPFSASLAEAVTQQDQ